jgi:protein-disulfide isomerase
MALRAPTVDDSMVLEHACSQKGLKLRLPGFGYRSYFSVARIFVAGLAISLTGGAAGLSAAAQTSMPPNQVTHFKDTSMLKPPAGAKVAIVEWEDLECPACAHAFPFVHAAVAQYHIPLVEYDFQIPGHLWSHEASIYARYLKDKVSPDLATDYRREVFASQFRIATLDDLTHFTQEFFAAHHQPMPPAIIFSPMEPFAREVRADDDLGQKLGLMETPTIIVVTPKGWIQVKDVADLYQAIDQAEAAMGTPAAHHTVAKK